MSLLSKKLQYTQEYTKVYKRYYCLYWVAKQGGD